MTSVLETSSPTKLIAVAALLVGAAVLLLVLSTLRRASGQADAEELAVGAESALPQDAEAGDEVQAHSPAERAEGDGAKEREDHAAAEVGTDDAAEAPLDVPGHSALVVVTGDGNEDSTEPVIEPVTEPLTETVTETVTELLTEPGTVVQAGDVPGADAAPCGCLHPKVAGCDHDVRAQPATGAEAAPTPEATPSLDTEPAVDAVDADAVSPGVNAGVETPSSTDAPESGPGEGDVGFSLPGEPETARTAAGPDTAVPVESPEADGVDFDTWLAEAGVAIAALDDPTDAALRAFEEELFAGRRSEGAVESAETASGAAYAHTGDSTTPTAELSLELVDPLPGRATEAPDGPDVAAADSGTSPWEVDAEGRWVYTKRVADPGRHLASDAHLSWEAHAALDAAAPAADAAAVSGDGLDEAESAGTGEAVARRGRLRLALKGRRSRHEAVVHNLAVADDGDASPAAQDATNADTTTPPDGNTAPHDGAEADDGDPTASDAEPNRQGAGDRGAQPEDGLQEGPGKETSLAGLERVRQSALSRVAGLAVAVDESERERAARSRAAAEIKERERAERQARTEREARERAEQKRVLEERRLADAKRREEQAEAARQLSLIAHTERMAQERADEAAALLLHQQATESTAPAAERHVDRVVGGPAGPATRAGRVTETSFEAHDLPEPLPPQILAVQD